MASKFDSFLLNTLPNCPSQRGVIALPGFYGQICSTVYFRIGVSPINVGGVHI
jgi:hypothetical protein